MPARRTNGQRWVVAPDAARPRKKRAARRRTIRSIVRAVAFNWLPSAKDAHKMDGDACVTLSMLSWADGQSPSQVSTLLNPGGVSTYRRQVRIRRTRSWHVVTQPRYTRASSCKCVLYTLHWPALNGQVEPSANSRTDTVSSKMKQLSLRNSVT